MDLRDRDRWMTPADLLELVARIWPQGIDLDPFYDPASAVDARDILDARNGQDAYTDWWHVPHGGTVWVNGPYSQASKTAEICACWRRAKGAQILNLTPAAPGSAYWRDLVWPHATAIAWMGRQTFVAGCDMMGPDGKVAHAKGTRPNANRTEIALVSYQDPAYTRAFLRIMSNAGHPVVSL